MNVMVHRRSEALYHTAAPLYIPGENGVSAEMDDVKPQPEFMPHGE